MHDESDKSGPIAAIGLVLILSLLIGGGIVYFVVARQRAALTQAEEARLAGLQARVEAERARAVAQAAIGARSTSTTANDKRESPGDEDAVRAAVEAVLRTQEEAWNRGDIDAFVEHYWKSADLTFSSGGKTTRGWQETLNRYKERYPTREKMGRVGFDGLEITALGDSAALVLGQWSLKRENEPLKGNFSLVFRKLDGRWVIIHDHTSRLTD
jgi:beta-aspartyl-peptidase (threonine type)